MVFHCTNKPHFVCPFYCWQLLPVFMDSASVTVLARVFWWICVCISVGCILGVELVGRRIFICSALVDVAKEFFTKRVFTKWHSVQPGRDLQVFAFSRILGMRVCVFVFHSRHSGGWWIIVVLSCFFLNWAPFQTHWVFSFVKCLFRPFAQFSIVFLSFSYFFVDVLHIFWI